MRGISWWKYGLLGMATLLGACSLGLPVKFIVHLVRFPADNIPWHEIPLVLLAVSAMGFVCGIVTWLLLPLSKKLGSIGDAIIGIIVIFTFFLFCMFLYDPSLLTQAPNRGFPMFVMAIIVGAVLGVWCGRDIRRFIKEQNQSVMSQKDVADKNEESK